MCTSTSCQVHVSCTRTAERHATPGRLVQSACFHSLNALGDVGAVGSQLHESFGKSGVHVVQQNPAQMQHHQAHLCTGFSWLEVLTGVITPTQPLQAKQAAAHDTW